MEYEKVTRKNFPNYSGYLPKGSKPIKEDNQGGIYYELPNGEIAYLRVEQKAEKVNADVKVFPGSKSKSEPKQEMEVDSMDSEMGSSLMKNLKKKAIQKKLSPKAEGAVSSDDTPSLKEVLGSKFGDMKKSGVKAEDLLKVEFEKKDQGEDMEEDDSEEMMMEGMKGKSSIAGSKMAQIKKLMGEDDSEEMDDEESKGEFELDAGPFIEGLSGIKKKALTQKLKDLLKF